MVFSHLVMLRGQNRRNKRSQRIAIAITGILLTVAVVAGMARAGGRYFYCEGMGMMGSDPCAVAHHDDTPATESSFCLLPAECCHQWTLPSMPVGATASEDAVPVAPLLSVIRPSLFLFLHSESALAMPSRSCEHRRRPPRPAGEVRARLMVFLT